MIPPQHWQDMVPLLIQTLKKALRDTSGGDFRGDHGQPGQGGYSKPQGKQPLMAMDTSTLQGQLETMSMNQSTSKGIPRIPEDLLITGW